MEPFQHVDLSFLLLLLSFCGHSGILSDRLMAKYQPVVRTVEATSIVMRTRRSVKPLNKRVGERRCMCYGEGEGEGNDEERPAPGR